MKSTEKTKQKAEPKISGEKHKDLVKRDMALGDVLQKHPEAAFVMMNYGLHCVGCHVAAYETIEQGAYAHGMTDEEIEKMVDEINKTVSKR